MSYWERFKEIKQIIAAIIKGILGIATEIGFALSIMLVAFFICVVLTSF
jgi:hypothetical protein